MKFLSLILVLFVMAFTSEAQVNNMLDFQEIAKDYNEQNCCGVCACDSCEDNRESCDDPENNCTQDCSCIFDGVVIFTLSISPEIKLFGTYLQKIRTGYVSYQFHIPPTIWHPPQFS